MNRRMEARALVALLQISPSTLNTWVNKSVIAPLKSKAKRDRPVFGYEAIEAFLRAHPNHPEGAESLPPLMEIIILAGTLKLPAFMTFAQAMEWLGMARAPLRLALETDLPSIRLGSKTGSIRIALPVLIDYAQDVSQLLTAEFVMDMLGIGWAHLLRLSPPDNSGPLKRRYKRGERGKISFAPDNLLEVIGQWLIKGTAEEWWRLRLEHKFEPLYTRNQLVASHHIGIRNLDVEIKAGRILCLNVPEGQGSVSRIPLHSIQQWAFGVRILSGAQVARIFGVSNPVAYRWLQFNKLCGLLHDRCPTYACLATYVEANKLGPFDAISWLKRADAVRPLRTSQHPYLKTALGHSQNAQEDPLHAVRLPNGDVAVLSGEIGS